MIKHTYIYKRDEYNMLSSCQSSVLLTFSRNRDKKKNKQEGRLMRDFMYNFYIEMKKNI